MISAAASMPIVTRKSLTNAFLEAKQCNPKVRTELIAWPRGPRNFANPLNTDKILYALNDVDCQRIMIANNTLDAFRSLIDARITNYPRGDRLIDKVDSLFKSDVFLNGQHVQSLKSTPTHLLSPVTYHLPQHEQHASKSRGWRRPDEDVTVSPSSPKPASFADVNPWADPNRDGNIARTKDGGRIDPPLSYSKKVRNGLARRDPRVCNVHHLRGPCPYGPKCGFSHDVLNEEEMRALRKLAREQPCRKGNECEDLDCFAGHHCPKNKRCQESCRFSEKANVNGKEMQIRGTKIVNVGPNGLGRTPAFNTKTAGELERGEDKDKQRAGKPEYRTSATPIPL